jgi:hypothetical protein
VTKEEFIGRAADALMRRHNYTPSNASVACVAYYSASAEAVLEAVGAFRSHELLSRYVDEAEASGGWEDDEELFREIATHVRSVERAR